MTSEPNYALPEPMPWRALAAPLAQAEDALARLDERLRASPVRQGWISRTHFTEACATLWLEGALVHLEDLVLHDVGMDVRAPTHELIRAHAVLRARRRIGAEAPQWALSTTGLAALRGEADNGGARQGGRDSADLIGDDGPPDVEDDPDGALPAIDRDGLDSEFAALDAAIARSQRVLDGEVPPRAGAPIYDVDWNENERLKAWVDLRDQTKMLPPLLAGSLLFEAWQKIEPLQHRPWLGSLLVGAHLREAKKTRVHLVCLNSGMRLVARERRRAGNQTQRLVAWCEAIAAGAEAGMKDHDRWLLARQMLERKLVGRRKNSHLGALIDVVLATPIASAGLIARELGVTPRAAQNLVAELGLREATGRGRYRAWGIL
jgi:Protein of unknown function (DUF1612)/HTH DNA binding domain